MSTYAASTSVGSDASRSEIARTVTRYGADQFAYMESADRAMVAFVYRGRQVRLSLPLPDRRAEEFTVYEDRYGHKKQRSASAAAELYEQAIRQRWRALALELQAAGATQIPLLDRGWQGNAPDGMGLVTYIARWKLQQGALSEQVSGWLERYVPNVDATCVFRVSHDTYDDYVHLFRPVSQDATDKSSAEAAVDPEWERQQAERRAAAAALLERHERFTALRTAFVEGLKARSITSAQAEILAGFVAHRDLLWIWQGFDGVDQKLRMWLGIAPFGTDTSDDQDDAVIAAAIAALDTGHALLALAVLGEEDELRSDNYSTDRAGAYYELLEQLGYTPSSEEVDALTVRTYDDDEGDHDAADEDDEG